MLYPLQTRRGLRRRWSNRDNFLNRYAAEAVKGKLETREEACARVLWQWPPTRRASHAWGKGSLVRSWLEICIKWRIVADTIPHLWVVLVYHFAHVSICTLSSSNMEVGNMICTPTRPFYLIWIWLISGSTVQLKHDMQPEPFDFSCSTCSTKSYLKKWNPECPHPSFGGFMA